MTVKKRSRGPEWTTACKDWERRIVAQESLIPFAPLFPAEAASALEVFKLLRVMDVQGSPTMGQICRAWITDFVGSLFGAYDPDIGRRLINEFFMLISKKNGKSTTAAGIMMTALIRNWRASAEFLIIAPTIEIANNSYIPARDMVKNDEELDSLFQVQDHLRTITHRVNKSTLKVVAADNETVGGKKATGVLIDELWLFGKQPNAENMLLEACGGLASRPEGFVVYLSTQSDSAPAGAFKKKLDYARGVRDGLIEDKNFLPVIYEFPKKMVEEKAYLNPKHFYVTNPNFGCSVDEGFILRKAKQAEHDGIESQMGFFAKHLNVEIGAALRADRWAGAEFWQQQAKSGISLEDVLQRSEVIDIGIDGGGLDDLLGLCVIGRDKVTKEWLVWTHAWAHPSVLERRKQEAPRFRDFEKDGDLTLVDVIGDDVADVAAICKQVNDTGKLDKIGLDPVGIGAILDAIVAEGVEQDKIVAISQGWKLMGAIKTAERKLAEGTMVHGGQAMMSWCVGNAKIEQKGNAVLITKAAAGSAKIDPLMALFDAVSLMQLNPAKDPEPQLFFL